MIELIEYIKIHILSLEQDSDKIKEEMNDRDEGHWLYAELDQDYNYTVGELNASRHILTVAQEILERYVSGQ